MDFALVWLSRQPRLKLGAYTNIETRKRLRLATLLMILGAALIVWVGSR